MFYEKMNGNTKVEEREERVHMIRENIVEHRPELHGHKTEHLHPIPPHERKQMVYVEFDQNSEKLFSEMFGNKEEAEIAMKILHSAPPEQQVIAVQLLRMNGVNVKVEFPKFRGSYGRWGAPNLGEEVYEAYSNTYGEDGECYVDVLESSPYEIAVISRMIAYMQQKKRGE